MNKRLSIRLTPKLSESIRKLAVERGSSMNSMISQILWEFIERYHTGNNDKNK